MIVRLLKVDLRYLIFAFIIWISISSASVLVILSGAPAEACAFWRLAISTLILLMLALLRCQTVLRGLRAHHVISGLMLALHFILWMRSLFLVEVYVSTLLVTTYPLYSLVVDVVLYRVNISRVQVFFVIFAAILVTAYLNVYELVFNVGAIYALIAGITCAAYFCIGRYARSKLGEDTIHYAFNTYLSATFITGAYSLITGVELVSYDTRTYVFFTLLALVPMIMGHTLMNYLLSKYPTSLVTSISYGEPFGAGLLAFLFLGQTLSPTHLIFGVAIVSSIVAISATFRG